MPIYSSERKWESPLSVSEALRGLEQAINELPRSRITEAKKDGLSALAGSAFRSRFFGLSLPRGRANFPMKISAQVELLDDHTGITVSVYGGLDRWISFGIVEKVFDDQLSILISRMKALTR